MYIAVEDGYGNSTHTAPNRIWMYTTYGVARTLVTKSGGGSHMQTLHTLAQDAAVSGTHPREAPVMVDGCPSLPYSVITPSTNSAYRD